MRRGLTHAGQPFALERFRGTADERVEELPRSGAVWPSRGAKRYLATSAPFPSPGCCQHRRYLPAPVALLAPADERAGTRPREGTRRAWGAIRGDRQRAEKDTIDATRRSHPLLLLENAAALR